MAVPTITDMKTLVPYGSNGGSVTLPSTNPPLIAKGPSGCVARYFYQGASFVKPGEEFTILARYHVPNAWTNGGGTILRVESYADVGSLLCRLEVDIFRDGKYHIVRNAHNNMGGTIDYYDFGQVGPAQIVGHQYDMALHGVLDSKGGGYAELYLDGNRVMRVDGRTWYDNAYSVERARYCLVQGPGAQAEARLYAAQLVPGLKKTTGAPTPEPPTPTPEPPTDPCAAVKVELAASKAALEAANERLRQIHVLSTP